MKEGVLGIGFQTVFSPIPTGIIKISTYYESTGVSLFIQFVQSISQVVVECFVTDTRSIAGSNIDVSMIWAMYFHRDYLSWTDYAHLSTGYH